MNHACRELQLSSLAAATAAAAGYPRVPQPIPCLHTCIHTLCSCLRSSMAAADSPEEVVAALEGCDILAAALAVLREPDPHRKAALTELIVRAWAEGRIRLPAPGAAHEEPPDRPARDETKVGLGGGGGPGASSTTRCWCPC